MITFKCFDYLTEDEKIIRTKVFVEEQGFNNEFDGLDEHSTHIVAYDGVRPIGCVRFYEENDGYHLGRLAVLSEYRGEHLGAKLVQKAEQMLAKNKAETITLSAQLRASGFYKKLGYNSVGEIYFDEYCEHIKMIKSLMPNSVLQKKV